MVHILHGLFLVDMVVIIDGGTIGCGVVYGRGILVDGGISSDLLVMWDVRCSCFRWCR